MTVQWVYMTAGSPEEAARIGAALVEGRLAACVNIIEGMRSLYVWDGRLQDERETVLIAKTTRERLPELVATVTALHSYDCPCILALPVQEGNTDFLEWIRAGVVAGTAAPGDPSDR